MRGADQLLVVSGYASALHAFDHLQQLNELDCPVRVELIVGMTRRGAVNEKEHAGFTQLCTAGTDNFQLTCSYVFRGIPGAFKSLRLAEKRKAGCCLFGIRKLYSERIQTEESRNMCGDRSKACFRVLSFN